MNEAIEEAIKTLAGNCKNPGNGADAQKYSQAVLNLVQAKAQLDHNEREGSKTT